MRIILIKPKKVFRSAARGLVICGVLGALFYTMIHWPVSMPTMKEVLDNPANWKQPMHQEPGEKGGFERALEQYVLKVQDFYYEERE